MRVFLWHVHGSWTTNFVQGDHDYLVPVLPGRGPDGRGRARTWDWPPSVAELSPAEARAAEIDLVVLQRPEELGGLAEAWTGRRPGRDVPAVYLEHNTPEVALGEARHWAADRSELTVVHVTHFNRLWWDTGTTPARVIEHGIIDPGDRYTGAVPHAAVVVNEPVRRGRVTGTDLLPVLGEAAPLDLFGMGTEALGGRDLTQAELHAALPQRRVYLHPYRWTSLGLSLIEAMQLGMPVVALATTEAPEAVPAGAGCVSNDLDRLCAALRHYVQEPEAAAEAGRVARAGALARYGLGRFLADWDALLAEVVSSA